MQDCFLCNPDSALIYEENEANVALCGLGPIVKGYSVVATRKHVRSAADAAAGSAQDFVEFAIRMRSKLIDIYGSCLITEHGRLPVCARMPGTSDPHCFHAHFLMFPNAPAVEEKARIHFAKVHSFSSLKEALNFARSCQGYFLLSPHPNLFLIMTDPRQMVRQFARLLVAEEIGISELADWKTEPLPFLAAHTAATLRLLFKE